MFQDLNRKLHHAEKDRESPASDTKVAHLDELIVSHFHSFFLSRKCLPKKENEKKIIKFENHSRGNSDVWKKKKQSNLCGYLWLPSPGGHLNKDAFSSFLLTVCEMECFFRRK